MPNTALPCDDNLLEALLAGKLPPERVEQMELHLEACVTCRQRLDQLAANPEEWAEAREKLSDTDLQVDGAGNPVSSGERRNSALRITEYLGPTDDPQMIGRLGAYEVAGIIGAGGMGVVLKGSDRALNRFVAIKVLAPHLAASATARRRFSREAQAAAAVVHDNVVAIHGVAEANGLPYLVMPYIRGQSLQKRLDERGTLTLVEALRIGHQIASGLAAAHSQGLVHRDIKPANILLEEGIERLRITDFGLARAVDDATLTQEGMLAGTPEYMSPEQARAEPVGPASDLFSLGSVLYAVCTGRPPFRGDTSYGVLRRITDNAPHQIRELNPEIPDWFEAIISKLLSKSPEQRFDSAEEVAKLLQECLAHVQHPTQLPLPQEALDLLQKRVAEPKPERRVTKAGIALIALVLLVGLVLALMQMMPGADNQSADGAKAEPPAKDLPPEVKKWESGPVFSPAPVNVPVEVGYVRAIGFSANGQWLAVGWGNHTESSKSRQGAVAIWSVAERQQVAVFPVGAGVYSLSFSSDSNCIALGCGDGSVKVLSRESGDVLLDEQLGIGDTAVRFSSKGSWLAAGSQSGELVLYSAKDFEKATTVSLEGDPAPVLALSFSGDESFLAAGGGTFPPAKTAGTARVWNIESGKLMATLVHGAAVMDVSLNEDGKRLATACLDARARLWNVQAGEVAASVRDPNSGLVGVKLLPDDRVATLGPRSGIKLWKWSQEEPLQLISSEGAHWNALALSPDGQTLATSGHDRRVRLWSATDGTRIAEILLTSANEPEVVPLRGLSLSSDGRRLAVIRDGGEVLVRDVNSGRILQFARLKPEITGLVAKGVNVSGSDVSELSKLQLKSRTLCITFGKRGQELLLGGADGNIRVLNIESGQVDTRIQAHKTGVASLALSGDGTKLVTGSPDREAALWKFPSGELIRSWRAHESAVNVTAFLPGGERVLTAGADSKAKVWMCDNGDLLATCDAHEQPIVSAAVSPNGRQIATGSEDGQLVVWSAQTGLDRRAFPRQAGAIHGLQYARQAETLLSAGEDGAVRVWNVASVSERQSLTGHSKPISGLGLVDADNAAVVTTGLDGGVKLWPSIAENAGSQPAIVNQSR